jgi:CO/xanthine dehydrogenase FAD-binding subunit
LPLSTLPLSTGVPILPMQSAQITGWRLSLVYKIDRFVISNAGTVGGSADWIVKDIKINDVSQFVKSGDVRGDVFATNAKIDKFVWLTPLLALDAVVVVVVTYNGLNERGCPFFGALLCR